MDQRTHRRLAVALTALTALFLVLGIGALGIIGAGGRDDRIYLVVLAVLVVGALLARLRSSGMVVVLAATALAQVLVGAVALLAGLPDDASTVDVVGITLMYAALFGACAWLFRQAATDR